MKSTRSVAVITGVACGVGKGCVLKLAYGGFNLLINDHPDADSVEKLHVTQQGCLAEGVEVICFPVDMGDPSLCEEMLDVVRNQWGHLDCLLNSAGTSVKRYDDFLDFESDSFDQNIVVNTRAPLFPVQTFSKRLLAQPKLEAGLPHCSTIFVSSINAIVLVMNHGKYTITKTAVFAAARLFAARFCNERTGVYEVHPGLIKADMAIPVTVYHGELVTKGLVLRGRRGHPANIASTVRTMAEGKLIYACGQTVAIDGGLSVPYFWGRAMRDLL